MSYSNSTGPDSLFISSTSSSQASFDVEISQNGVLAFTTNYHPNWSIYVDDIKVDSKEINKVFLGCDIAKGSHHLRLVYENSLIKKGLVISLLGLVIWGIVYYCEKRKEKLWKK